MFEHEGDVGNISSICFNGGGEPPPTAPTRELVNVLHMWDPLMQF